MREKLLNKQTSSKFTTKEICSNIPEQKFIKDLIKESRGVSVELCPNDNLDFEKLKNGNFKFVSVTWFKPSTDDLKNPENIPAIGLAKKLICEEYNVLLHLTVRNLKKDEAKNILDYVESIGVRNILVLQGDFSQILEKDDNKCDFPYATNFVEFIRKNYNNIFCLGVAGYPEKHPNSEDSKIDLLRLKQKVDAGADFIITQACFNVDTIKKFAFLCKQNEIIVPIIPGLFIINSYKSLKGMADFCGVPVPTEILDAVGSNRDDQEAVKKYSVDLGVNMVNKLLFEIVDDVVLFSNVHVFTLNNLDNVVVVKNSLKEMIQ